MNGADGNGGFGWMLIIIGSVIIAGIGLIWVLAPNLRTWAPAGRYPDRERKQPVLLRDCDVHRDQRRTEPRDLADPYRDAVIRAGWRTQAGEVSSALED